MWLAFASAAVALLFLAAIVANISDAAAREYEWDAGETFTSPFSWRDIVQAHAFCNSTAPLERLHPQALAVLALWSRGLFTHQQARRAFSLPNSGYIGVVDCINGVISGATAT